MEIAAQIADSDDVREVVSGLEQQYDAFHTKSANLLAEDEPLPSGGMWTSSSSSWPVSKIPRTSSPRAVLRR